MSDKVKYPAEDAKAVARELCSALKVCTDRLIVAGSLRRRRSTVGDVEILFVPTMGTAAQPGQLFAEPNVNLAEIRISRLLAERVLKYRPTATGANVYGPKNKLLVHVASGIPVDLFTATERNWFNYLVCRTGGKDNNMRLAARAQEMGYKWHPYGAGLSRNSDGTVIPIASEQHLFEFLRIPYLEPWERS